MNRVLFLAALIALTAQSFAQKPPSAPDHMDKALITKTKPNNVVQSAAEAVVQKQVEAYNARDLEAFLATYADDAQLFEFPDKPLARGAAQLRERYSARFAEPGLHAEIVNRVAMGNTVVDHEQVRRQFPEGAGSIDAIAIYEVDNGKIAKVWFRFGEKKLD